MKLFYNSDGTVKVLPVSALPANAVWNGGFPYTPEGSLLVSIVSAKPTDTVSNGGFIQELWGGVCAGYDTPSIWIGGLAITSYGALCLDVDGGIVTDGPVIYNSLTNSLIPTRGSLTPTFTRATTETGQKWDEAGYLDFTALAGEIVWKGARRERNLIPTASEDFSSADWLKVSTTVVANQAVAPDGTTTADLVYPTTTGELRYFWRTITGVSVVGATKLVQSVYAKAAGMSWIYLGRPATGSNQGAWFNVSTGVVGTIIAGALTPTIEDVGDGWYRCSLGQVDTGDTSAYPIYSVADADNSTTATTSGTNGVYFWGAQLEDVTGQTTQTASEYVSVGVESAPAYHGSMVDGVKCYDTDRSGNPISTSGSYPLVGYVPWEARTNLCLQSNAFATAPWTSNGAPSIVQNATGPDGATSAWTVTDSNAGLAEYLIQGVTLTAATHSFSLRVGKTVGATTYPLVFVGASPLGAVMTLDTNNGVATVWTQYDGGWTIVTSSASCVSVNDDFWRFTLTFLATAASWNLVFWPAATSNPTQSTGTFTPSLTGSAVFYGAQVELGSFATPYIPTTTVAVARNADLLTYTGADVANIKALACTFSRGVGVATPGAVVALTDGTANERHTMIFNNATQFFIVGSDGGVNRYLMQPTYTPGTTSKAAVTFATNDVKADFNGTAQTPDTAATMPTVTQINVGHEAGIAVGNCAVNHIYGWTRNLSQSELGAIDRA